MQINIFGSTFYLCNIYFTKCQVKNQDRIQIFYSEYFFELKKENRTCVLLYTHMKLYYDFQTKMQNLIILFKLVFISEFLC